MPTTTPSSRRKHFLSRGFTLVEVIVATTLSGVVLAGVLSAVLMISRSGYLLNNYIDMEKEARVALETLGVDARITSEVSWLRTSETASPYGVILTAPDTTIVTYTYNSANGQLSRTLTTPSGVVSTSVLITGIQSLTFTAYQYDEGKDYLLIDSSAKTTTAMNSLTKMLQVSLSAVRSKTILADATTNVVSARYVLRNKIQSN